jgi:hypothetical protein
MADLATMMHKTQEKLAQATPAENKNETRQRAARRRQSVVDEPLGGRFFVKIVSRT